MDSQKLYYDGRYQKSIGGQTFQTNNPATNSLICDVYEADERDLEKAINAAKQGFEIWSAMAPVERGRCW